MDKSASQQNKKPPRRPTWEALWWPLVTVFPFVIFAVTVMGLNYLHMRYHPIIAVPTALVLIFVAAALLYLAWDPFQAKPRFPDKFPKRTLGRAYQPDFVAIVFATAIGAALMFTVIGAELSFQIQTIRGYFSDECGTEYGYLAHVKTYLWFLFDLVPFVDPKETFGFNAPAVKPHG